MDKVGPPSECPRCGTLSLSPDVGELGEAACGRCRGRLLSSDAVTLLVVEQLGHPPGFLKELADHFTGRGVACGLCQATTSIVTLRGCTLDLCLRCGAAWLDEGELSRLSSARFSETPPPPWQEPPPVVDLGDAAPSETKVTRPSPYWRAAALLLFGVLLLYPKVQNAWFDEPEAPAAPVPTPRKAKPPPSRELNEQLADLEQRCERDDSSACVKLVELRYRPGPAQDFAAAARIYSRLCDLGSLIACFNLAHMLEVGRGVAPDLPRSLALFEKACPVDGDYRSCRQAGLLYEQGKGVPRDLARARAHFENACIAGNDTAACAGLKRLDGG